MTLFERSKRPDFILDAHISDRPPMHGKTIFRGKTRIVREVDYCEIAVTSSTTMDDVDIRLITITLTDSDDRCPVMMMHGMNAEMARTIGQSLIELAEDEERLVAPIAKAALDRAAGKGAA